MAFAKAANAAQKEMLQNEIAEAWHLHAALPGDPYPERDDKTRGVCLARDGTESAAHLTVDRKVRAGLATQKGRTSCGDTSAFDLGASSPDGLTSLKVDGWAVKQSRAARFTEESSPPRLPADNSFPLAITVVHIRSESPSRIGNSLLDFLHEQVVSLSVKVKYVKYSIKVDTLHGGAACCLKLRVYEMEHARYAVEAQRRRGDCVVFIDLFSKLVGYLDERCGVLHGPSYDRQAPLRLTHFPPIPRDFQPLLDMAGRAEQMSASFRSELAAGFLHAAQDAQRAVLLCKVGGIKALTQLAQASREEEGEEVWYLAAATLHHLALCQDAGPFFMLHGAFAVILDKLKAISMSNVVRLELSKALSTLVARVVGRMSEHAAQQLERAMSDIMPSHAWSARAIANLQEARSTLESRYQTP